VGHVEAVLIPVGTHTWQEVPSTAREEVLLKGVQEPLGLPDPHAKIMGVT